jgi:hypothetical protein
VGTDIRPLPVVVTTSSQMVVFNFVLTAPTLWREKL